jgi:hypothetical protein
MLFRKLSILFATFVSLEICRFIFSFCILPIIVRLVDNQTGGQRDLVLSYSSQAAAEKDVKAVDGMVCALPVFSNILSLLIHCFF